MSSDSEDLGEGVDLRGMDSDSDLGMSGLEHGQDGESDDDGDDGAVLGGRFGSQTSSDLDMGFSRFRPSRARLLPE